MTLLDLASVGSFISGVGVLLSLLYLSMQIRQNTKHTRALIHQGRVDRATDLSWRWIHTDWSEFGDCGRGSADVTPTQLAKYLLGQRSMFVSFEDTFIQHREGLMEGEALFDAEAMIRQSTRGYANRLAWHVLRPTFSAAYQAYIDRIIAETPVHDETNNDMAKWKEAIAASRGAVPAEAI